MTKLEKVTKGLEQHMGKGCLSKEEQSEPVICPYFLNSNCITALCRDTLELLKEQEPHVLTLNEALWGDECWFEYRTVNVGRYADCYIRNDSKNAVIYFTGNAVAHPYELANYGKTWRCWNTRPTDEQRKAAKWE